MSTLLSQKRVKARKPNECSLCHKPIAKGEEHRASRLAFDGRAYTFRECDRCAPYLDELLERGWWSNDDGYTYDDMEEMMIECHQEVWQKWKDEDEKVVQDVH